MAAKLLAQTRSSRTPFRCSRSSCARSATSRHARLNIFPDGGIASCLFGATIKKRALPLNHMRLVDLNALDDGAAVEAFRAAAVRRAGPRR